ncbi:MAG TPA: hypothetical protein PK559_07595 [Ignavibacteriaceae bacterium]|nr:hypothetical protein [Ignavibacteriaceae bacterium]
MQSLKKRVSGVALLTAITLLTLLILPSCDVKSPTAPSWDVELNLPLLDSTYTLLDIVEKDTTILSPDYTRDGLLVYSTIEDVEKIEVSDKLSVDGFQTSSSKEIGTISIDGDSSQASVGFDWSQQGLAPGNSVPVLAENNRSVTSNLAEIDQFQSAIFENGIINVQIKNNFTQHVTITINGITIKNSAAPSEVVATSSSQLVIPPNGSGSFPAIPISKTVTVKNQLTFQTIISISGSNGNLVTIPQNAFIVTAKFENLEVKEARAKIPVQNPVVIDSSIFIESDSPKPTKIKFVKIDQGSLNIVMNNNLDVDASIKLEIPNLKNPSGVAYSVTRDVARKATNFKFVDNASLSNYTIESLTAVATNEIKYKVTFTTKSSSDFRTLKSSDDFEANIDFSSLTIKEFEGVVKPTALDETRSAVSLDAKDLATKFGFTQINFNKPVLELRMRPSTGSVLNFQITGRLEAQNSKGEKSFLFLNKNTMSDTIITQTDTVITLNADSVSNFFKRFSQLPDSIIVYAGGTLNPKYQTVSVTNQSYVTGRSRIEFPLDIGISAGQFTDSIEVEFDQAQIDEMNNLNNLDMSLILTNGLPVSINFTGKVYDSTNTFLMYFPPKYSTQDTVMVVPGGVTNTNGVVTTKTINEVKVKLEKAEVQKFTKAKYMRILIKINTSRTNNSPVKFRTKDDIRIKGFGGVNYRIKP